MPSSEVNYLDAVAALIRSYVPTEVVPREDTDLLFRIYAVLVMAGGESVTPADVHNAWVAWRLERDQGHDAFVPFEDLPADVAREDMPFVTAIRKAAQELSSRGID